MVIMVDRNLPSEKNGKKLQGDTEKDMNEHKTNE